MTIDENGNTDLMRAIIRGDLPEIARIATIITLEEKEVLND